MDYFIVAFCWLRNVLKYINRRWKYLKYFSIQNFTGCNVTLRDLNKKKSFDVVRSV